MYVDCEADLVMVPVCVVISVEVGILEDGWTFVPQYASALLLTWSRVISYFFSPSILCVPHASWPFMVMGAAVMTLMVE